MPAIITHDTFGQEVYGRLYELIGGSRDEAEAFLLGNQGPDPLFYSVLDPRLTAAHQLGSIMHRYQPDALLIAFKQSIMRLPEHVRSVARAYVLGFMCHYVLDSSMHPLVYAQQYALCDAGVPGLTRADGNDVHALIESELDELVLTVKRHETIATFNPARAILHARNDVLNVISAQYAIVAKSVYGIEIPIDTFRRSVKLFRFAQGVFYSPSGLKHNLLGRIETLVRPHSFYRAMSHRNRELTVSQFDNHEHAVWHKPATGEASAESFWDIFDRALRKAQFSIPLFDAPLFDEYARGDLTGGLDFSGEPARAEIVKVEEA